MLTSQKHFATPPPARPGKRGGEALGQLKWEELESPEASPGKFLHFSSLCLLTPVSLGIMTSSPLHRRGQSLPPGLVEQYEFENSLAYIATETLSSKDNKSITRSGSDTAEAREGADVGLPLGCPPDRHTKWGMVSARII